MTSTLVERISDTVDLFPHRFDIPKTSSADSVAILASQLIHAIENPTPASQFKFEEPTVAAIKVSEFFIFAVQLTETQCP